MIDRFNSLIKETKNNFVKCSHIESELLWGDTSGVIHPWISVIIITYKRPDYFKQAFESVLRQQDVSYPWEILVMDNNPEETELLGYIAKKNNRKVRYYRNKKNLQHEGNINRGAELARGEWIALLHDDDLLAPDYLILIEQYIKACANWKKPLAYIKASYIEFQKIEEVLDEQQFENRNIEKKASIKPELWIETLIRGCGLTYINSCGSLIHRNRFFEIGGYNDELNPIGDSTLGLIFMEKGYSICPAKRVLGFYRQGDNTSSKKETVLNFLEADTQLRDYLYSRNWRYRLFGKIFGGLQFSNSVEVKLKISNKYCCEHQDQQDKMISVEEINRIRKYKKYYIRKYALKIMNVGLQYIYRKGRLKT